MLIGYWDHILRWCLYWLTVGVCFMPWIKWNFMGHDSTVCWLAAAIIHCANYTFNVMPSLRGCVHSNHVLSICFNTKMRCQQNETGTIKLQYTTLSSIQRCAPNAHFVCCDETKQDHLALFRSSETFSMLRLSEVTHLHSEVTLSHYKLFTDHYLTKSKCGKPINNLHGDCEFNQWSDRFITVLCESSFLRVDMRQRGWERPPAET